MTVIVFNAKGKPFWKSVTTNEFREMQKKDCLFTDFDKDWFRKPLTKGVNYWTKAINLSQGLEFSG